MAIGLRRGPLSPVLLRITFEKDCADVLHRFIGMCGDVVLAKRAGSNNDVCPRLFDLCSSEFSQRIGLRRVS